MLVLENVSVFYDRIQAVKGISMEVREGEIVTLIGGNGAGKSTTLNAITGIKKIQSGKISVGNMDITNGDASRIVKMGITQSPEGRRVFPKMTVLENLEMGAYVSNDKGFLAKNIERSYRYFQAGRTQEPICRDSERWGTTDACNCKGSYGKSKDPSPG